MKRTLREWKKLWESWDTNDYADLDHLFEEAEIDDYWEKPCEIDLILTTIKGNIGLAEVRIFDEEGAILVTYEYDVPYEMGRPELMDLIESLNNQDLDEDEKPTPELEREAEEDE